MAKYLHQHPDWPKFRWRDTDLAEDLRLAHLERGQLFGGLEVLGFEVQRKAAWDSISSEVQESAAIEGEIFDHASVRSSVALRLGLPDGGLGEPQQRVEGMVEVVMRAVEGYAKPLTKEELYAWHSTLFPTGYSAGELIRVGAWRDSEVQIVSGRADHPTVHFEGPHPSQVSREMARFLKWLNADQKVDPLVKAGIAHLWFECIHPFEDGNGRIGRAVMDRMLAAADRSPLRYYSVSAQFGLNRSAYYGALRAAETSDLDLTEWLIWFVGVVRLAIRAALVQVETSQRVRHFWERLTEHEINERQRKLLALLLEGFEGKLTTSKWAKIAKCSQDTAYRDIIQLVELGVLRRSAEAGRSTSYELIEDDPTPPQSDHPRFG